jgi:hypothetical protein
MRRLVTASIGAAAFVLAGLIASGALAQEKKIEKATPKVELKTIIENEKVKVYEATYVPGAENPSPPSSSTRVVRALTAGKFERRHADGKIEKIDWKPGMVQVLPPSGPYTTKNVGATKLQLYVVQIK